MGKYFLQNRELPEPDAANRWFAYAESHGIDIPKAISIWEDAATESGTESRRLVSAAGIDRNALAFGAHLGCQRRVQVFI
ncbi:hypothetical protein LMG28614_06135 [Paraburkholderia ultramafica]|uniref:Uncharacterized protein n=1 Tax=Paraburkholderia ultramafica TaxID=1544867 RepID=A0A6S7BVZ9_9BURK|nr:hypothetical protein [Paraburkholderia ultramafica]CAB3805072.1 hypothetical protein LMG28614_06135 [Paraburkholderia ultramafica]